jgi:hypothetical protein
MGSQPELNDKLESKNERPPEKSDGGGLLESIKSLCCEEGIKALKDALASDKAATSGTKGTGELPKISIGDEEKDSKIGTAPVDKIGKTAKFDADIANEIPTGATVDRRTDADGFTKETVSKNGESVVNTYDEGELVSKEYKLPDGRTLTGSVEEGKLNGAFTITEPNGKFTELFSDDKGLHGERRDAGGKVIEKVTLVDGKLVYEDVKTHEKRAETFEPPTREHLGFRSQDLGKYDANTGTISKDIGADAKLVGSFANGRVDIVQKSGFVTGTTLNGEVSFQNPETREAAVMNPDGTGVHLKPDGTLNRWGPKASDNANGERLSPGEEAYLKKHPNADLRDVAEVHQRFHGDTQKLDNFYKSLEKLDATKNLTDAQKEAVRKDVLHHVANPEEIYQGVTDSCNVSVIQRDLAITNPEKYASTIVEAVSQGTFTANDGHKTKLDVKNLTMADSSGRDLASRIFQTATLRGEFDPGKVFENTPDGVGRLKPGKDDPRGTPTQVFDGLFPNEIAEIRHKLTGDEKAITFIKTADDLKTALDRNGGPPMTVFVDGSADPFGEGGSDKAPNHVVTITGIEAGPPVKYLVQNQLGLENDHSTPATAIPADKLMENMTRHREDGGPIDHNNGAIVLTNGDHNKAFGIIDGRHAEIPEATRNLAASNRGRSRVGRH